MRYLKRIGTDETTEKIFEWYKKAAEQGHTTAQEQINARMS